MEAKILKDKNNFHAKIYVRLLYGTVKQKKGQTSASRKDHLCLKNWLQLSPMGD